ncbi:MAG: hypothetical protein AAFO07_21945 [Bacteroidota bacterium]
MKYTTILTICILFVLPSVHFGQIKLEYNANIDFELSKAGGISHFYYNEIHRDKTDWNFNALEANLITKVILHADWSINTRLMLQRNLGKSFNQFDVPLLNVQWKPDGKTYGLQLGRIINPFGSFNIKQISTERDFIGRPLAYQYYVNVSPTLGYQFNLGETRLEGLPYNDWGSPILNYQGYASGIRFDWTIDPGKLNLGAALTTGAANLNAVTTNPLHIGFSSRLSYQLTYYWKQGISIHYGGFMEEHTLTNDTDPLSSYTQLLLGTDYQLGFGFFEISGEAIFARYTVPEFSFEDPIFVKSQTHTLGAFTSYCNIKYEPPFLSGSYLAYRLDGMWFGNDDNNDQRQWDNGVVRHTLAAGYRMTEFLWIRGSVSTQITQNFAQWNDQLGAFRLMLTAFY